jgi:AcrR family transcriptional regulator
MKKDASTEEKIKAAAKEVFLAKGFAGCSSREIAKAAGENVALVNYYFRSKGQLFELIFKAAMEDFLLSMLQVFSSDQSLEQKMRIFIENEFEFLSKHPELPSFIINEMNREEGCASGEHTLHFEKIAETGIFNECAEAQQKGIMREISLISITLLVMSNCQYPIMAKNLIKNMHHLSDDEYSIQLKNHQQHVIEMLVNYLFPKNNSTK